MIAEMKQGIVIQTNLPTNVELTLAMDNAVMPH